MEREKRDLNTMNRVIIAFVLLAVAASAVGLYFVMQKGVYVGDDFYHKAAGNQYVYNGGNYIRQKSDREFELAGNGQKKTAICDTDGNHILVKFEDGNVQGDWNGEIIVTENGSPAGFDEFQITFNGEKTKISDAAYATAIAQIVYHDTTSRMHWASIILGWFCFALGVVAIVNPNFSAFFLKRWQYDQEPELSDIGVLVERIGGVICLVIGIIFMSGLYTLFEEI